MKIIWVKPSKQEVETNDLPATIKHCETLGWKKKGPKKKAKKAD